MKASCHCLQLSTISNNFLVGLSIITYTNLFLETTSDIYSLCIVKINVNLEILYIVRARKSIAFTSRIFGQRERRATSRRMPQRTGLKWQINLK